MSEYRLQLSLPKSLADEARRAGLLTPEAIERLIRAELRKRRVDTFFQNLDRLAALQIRPLTPEEIEEEIQAVRLAGK